MPLNSEALEQMKQSNELLGINSDYVFPRIESTCSTSGRLIRSLNHLAELANVQYLGVHSLRHSFASALIKKGISVKVIAEILGHSDTHFTENTYVHVDINQKLDAVQALNNEVSDYNIDGKLTILAAICGSIWITHKI